MNPWQASVNTTMFLVFFLKRSRFKQELKRLSWAWSPLWDYCRAGNDTGRQHPSVLHRQRSRALIVLSDFVSTPVIPWLMFGSVLQSELERVLLELRSAAVKPTECRIWSCRETSAHCSSQHTSAGGKKTDRAPYRPTAATYKRLKRLHEESYILQSYNLYARRSFSPKINPHQA